MLWLVTVVFLFAPADAAKIFHAEPEQSQHAVKKESSVKLLPPKFVAEKYGIHEGDKLDGTTAQANRPCSSCTSPTRLICKRFRLFMQKRLKLEKGLPIFSSAFPNERICFIWIHTPIPLFFYF